MRYTPKEPADGRPMTPAEHGAALAARMPPLTDEQVAEMVRIIASVPIGKMSD